MNNFKRISLALSLAASIVAFAASPALGQTATLICSPTVSTVAPGQNVTFNVTGGSGTFSFSGTGITATTTASSSFTTNFSNNGTNSFTVASNGQTATCSVNVQPGTSSSTLICSPTVSTVAPGQNVTFNLTGGNGSFAISGNGLNTTTTNGSFNTSFSSTGTQNVTVTSGGQTATCSVNVQSGVTLGTLTCTPSLASVNQGQAVNFNLAGGNGSYTLSGNGLNTTTSGTVFGTSFSGTGTQSFTVTSGGQTATCSVNVLPVTSTTNNGTLSCVPATSVVNPGQSVNFYVSGGNGTFSFSGGSIIPSTSTNNVYNTSFSATGANSFTVTSGGQTATCAVNVVPVSSTGTTGSNTVMCGIPSGTVTVGQPAVFTATGGNGTYTFSSPTLSISNPVGTAFTAVFATPGVQIVTATSNGQSATCAVNVQPAASTGTGPVMCTPSTQTGTIGGNVNFVATGGNGVYVWSASDLRLINPTGSGFRANYATAGTHMVTVTSNGQSSTCAVNILPLSTPGLPNTGFAPVWQF